MPVFKVEKNDSDDCHHLAVYYSYEHDNFYCLRCKAGQGQSFYKANIGIVEQYCRDQERCALESNVH